MATINLDGKHYPVNTIFCIGRNYVNHVKELNNELPKEPLVFFKPLSSLTSPEKSIQLPKYSNNIHFEGELLLYIGEKVADNPYGITKEEALSVIEGVGLGLDLTARDIQDLEKSKGHPWSKSKAFPQAAAHSNFIAVEQLPNLEQIHYELIHNGQVKQIGKSQLMIFPLPEIIHYLSKTFGLFPGDIIYTGTPEGVAQVQPGDTITLRLENHLLEATFHFEKA